MLIIMTPPQDIYNLLISKIDKTLTKPSVAIEFEWRGRQIKINKITKEIGIIKLL
jgi:hypothetical protein